MNRRNFFKSKVAGTAILASYLPKSPVKPVEGSNARLIERKKDGSVYWQNTLIERDAKIPEYE